MRAANGWKQYRILDTSEQEKLESWNGVTLVRPDPQVIWKTPAASGVEKCGRTLQPFLLRRRKLGIFPQASGVVEDAVRPPRADL